MYAFIAGVIVGIVIATVGVSGMAKVVDHGVDAVKQQSQTLAR